VDPSHAFHAHKPELETPEVWFTPTGGTVGRHPVRSCALPALTLSSLPSVPHRIRPTSRNSGHVPRSQPSSLSVSTSNSSASLATSDRVGSVKEFSAPTLPADLALECTQYDAAGQFPLPPQSPLIPVTLLPDRPMLTHSFRSRRPISQMTRFRRRVQCGTM